MKKNTKIILMVSICLISVGIVFTAIGLVTGASPSHIVFNGLWNTQFHFEDDYENDYNKNNTYRVSAEAIDSLEIDWIAGDVTVVPYDGNDIIIKESSRSDLNDKNCLRYKVDGNMLQIEYQSGTAVVNFPDSSLNASKTLTVKLPRHMAQNLEEFNFDAVSSDINVRDITTNALNIGTTSGNLIGNNLKATYVEMSSTSGDMRVKKLTTESLEMDTTSGKLIGHSIEASRIAVDTISGDMDAAFLYCPKEFGFDSTSGECTITLPKDSSVSASFDSASGGFSTEFPSKSNGDGEYIIGNGSCEFDVSTISGDFTIKRAAK